MSSTGPSAAAISSGKASAIFDRSIVTVVSGEPSTGAASVACDALVGPGPVEADRERGDRLAALPAAKAQDDRRIEPAADVADDRHVAPQPALDRLREQRLELLDQRRRVVEPPLLAGVGEVEVPVLCLSRPGRPGP